MKHIAVLFMTIFCCAAAFTDTIYVSPDGTLDAPYDSWATAANDIQTAVDAASAGDTVFVTNGIYNAGGAVTPGYSLNNRVCITRAISVESVNGPEVTIVDGAGAMRGVYLSAGTLSGFTVTHGATWESGGSWQHDRSGGGVWLGDGTTASNCVISKSSAATGGGVFLFNGGVLSTCRIVDNISLNEGGGVFVTHDGAQIDRCEIRGNGCFADGSDGGGIWLKATGASVQNCLITGNEAEDAGGGACFSIWRP